MNSKLEPPLKIKVSFEIHEIERNVIAEVRGYHKPILSSNPLEPDAPGEVDCWLCDAFYIPLETMWDISLFVEETILDCLKLGDAFPTELDMGEIE